MLELILIMLSIILSAFFSTGWVWLLLVAFAVYSIRAYFENEMKKARRNRK